MPSEPLRVSTSGASSELVVLQPGVFGLRAVAGPSGTFGALLEAALEAVRAQGGRALHVRVDTATGQPDAAPALVALGFVRVSERAEFEATVSDLPDDAGSPLAWEALPDLGEHRLREAAALLKRAGEGDPDWQSDDDAFELLKGYLADPALTGGPDCVAVGRLGESPAAIVVAQVHRTSGVGRLTYLGVFPEFRGRGLGAWVHRHGFAMMAAQGAERYRGGTLTNNLPMLKLFSRHSCPESRRLEEWVWRHSDAPAT
ncbi:MAG: GNAT family N-acetyltransferase [Myxococcales bacterium]|nr:GNAT family N-acetyltransferase [Myxococcales bacterium]